MARPLQYVPESMQVFEVTVRCIQGRFLMRPGVERNRRMLGVIARSLEVCAGHVELYLVGCTSNHAHFIVGVEDAEWKARWKSHLLTNLSKELGDLYDWPGAMFERRCRDIPILDDEALVERLVYTMSQAVKEGLVRSPSAWPGIPWVEAVTQGVDLVGVWYDRTRWHRLRRGWSRGEKSQRGKSPCLADVAVAKTVTLAVPPIWRDLDEVAVRAKWCELAEIALERYPAPSRVLGCVGVLAAHPHHRPMKSKHSPAPKVHTACRRLRAAWLEAYASFVAAYRAAMMRLKDGWLEVGFPPGGCRPACLLGDRGG